MDRIGYASISTPIGWILVAASEKGVCLLDFCGSEEPTEKRAQEIILSLYPDAKPDAQAQSELIKRTKEALLQYFHSRAPMPPLPLDMRRGTRFQQEVWQALCRIPFGSTRSYAEIAGEIGRPKGPRAIGQACGRNPIAILIPCHRIVTSAGRLGGYSGGLSIKEALLKLEQS